MPMTVEWNAALQQAVGGNQSVTISYVASNGRRLVKENVINATPLNPNFGSVILYENALTSNYQSLQIQFQRQISHGIEALASYTWSHALDYGSSDAVLGYQRGNADFDVRNNLAAALSWDLPLCSNNNDVARILLNRWSLDARFMVRTAFPVTLTGNYYFDPETEQETTTGLNLVSGSPLYTYSSLLPGGRAINPAAFSSTPPGIPGTAPRNFVRGFGANQVNAAVRREVPLPEHLTLQFRAEAFNIFNRPNFGYIDPTLTDATFGQATQTLAQSLGTLTSLYQQGGARSMQFALKIVF
jgi:hypothetical protein